MKRTIFLYFALFFSLACSEVGYDPEHQKDSYHPKPEEIWPLVAKSHFIVIGRLDVPTQTIEDCLTSNNHQYAEIQVKTNNVLKGSIESSFKVRWFTKPRKYTPNPDTILAFDGRKALLFLIRVDHGSTSEYYFAGHSPLALSKPGVGTVEKVRREIDQQQTVLTNFDSLFPAEQDPLHSKVKRLIDVSNNSFSQSFSFRRLAALGPSAVPSIIMLMDDRRSLSNHRISLRNSPGSGEGIRHYGPENVVDAMDAILNQITGELFGTISNGGTERERQAAVDGWRIYLYYWKQTHNQKNADGPNGADDNALTY